MNFSQTTRYSNFLDLKNPQWKNLYNDISEFSNDYLSSLQNNNLWPKEYSWPKDSLHTNTRVWEYPYVADAIYNACPKNGKVLDIGSALTFFPHYLANKGYQVYATDINVNMINWYNQIISSSLYPDFLMATNPIHTYDLEDVTDLSYPDESFDAVTNVSVLEHLPIELIIKSTNAIHKVLKKDGVFVCTLDSYIKGARVGYHSPLNDEELDAYIKVLESKFEFITPSKITTPSGLITNINIPDFLERKNRQLRFIDSLKLGIKTIIKREYPVSQSLEWTALGFILKKK